MKSAGRWIGAVGLLLAIALFAREGIEPVTRLLFVAGFGLLFAASFHLVPMLFNVLGWRALLTPDANATVSVISVAVLVRESINGLLPVARIGGEIAAYRWVTRSGVPRALVAASLVVDLVLSLLSQGIFCLVGVVLMCAIGGNSSLQRELAGGLGVLTLLAVSIMWLQRSSLIDLLVRRLDSAFCGRWPTFTTRSLRLDQTVRDLYQQKRRLCACLSWQLLAWVAGAGEIWLALYFLGHQVDLSRAIVIEASVQMVSSIAFLVPGAFGIQEGGLLAVGALLGIDGPTALALAASRRLRDLWIFLPGLLVWQRCESHLRSSEIVAPDARA